MSENIIKQMTGHETLPDYAEKFSAGHLIDKHKIIEYMDFNESDMPRHRSTVLQTNTKLDDFPSYEKTSFIQLELRIGEKQFTTFSDSWELSHDVSKLRNSDYFIGYSHEYNDKTYVYFYFSLPEKLQRYVEEYERRIVGI